MRVTQGMQREVRVAGLPQHGLGPRTDVIGRVIVAIGLAEDQVVGSIRGSECQLVLVLLLSMCGQDFKREVVQTDIAGCACSGVPTTAGIPRLQLWRISLGLGS